MTVIFRVLATIVNDATKIQLEDMSISSANVHMDMRDASSKSRPEPQVNEVLGGCQNIREMKREHVPDFRRAWERVWTGEHSNFARNIKSISRKGLRKQPRHCEVEHKRGTCLTLVCAVISL